MRIVILAVLVWGLGRGAAAEEGLVAYWRFEAEGPQITDLSGKGHPATRKGGEIVAEGNRRFLRLDGQSGLIVPPTPELSLRRGFSIEMRVRFGALTDGHLLAFKDNEYLLRVDWLKEQQNLSWFVHVKESWEPRVSAFRPALNCWYHVVAVWDGVQLTLWVDGQAFAQGRYGEAPPATNHPLLIGMGAGYGRGLIGDLEYVKIYNRALSPREIMQAAYGAGLPRRSLATAANAFDFRQGAQGWLAGEGAKITPSPAGLQMIAESRMAAIQHDNLQTEVERRDYAAVRMAVERGSTGTLFFVTERGAGRIRFPVQADGQWHTYVLEPWEVPGWGGKLLCLGLIPTDAGGGAKATIQYVRVTEEPSGEGELRLRSLISAATLPRAGRMEKICVTVTNVGGPTRGVKIVLQTPKGVELLGPAEQVLPVLGYQEEREITWPVRVKTPGAYALGVTASGPDTNRVELRATIRFQPAVKLARASYVPPPQPVNAGPYQIWTHYCPLWKVGTHYGWQAIEAWPERKPVIGWYNEGSPEVADWHIKYWLEHGISAVIYCWYRANRGGPVQQSLGHAIHDGLLKARYLPLIKFGIMWENGCGQGVDSPEDLLNNVLPFWLDNYFTHPSYLKIEGKPVLYVWVPRNVTRDLGGSENVRRTFEAMRQKCRERGLAGLYIVGCVGAANREELERMKAEGWDASSAYGNSWTYPANTVQAGDWRYAPYEEFIVQQEAIWKGKEAIGALPDITTVMMGWDARPWKSSPFYWADNTPEKFRELCRRAKAVMDARQSSGPEKNTIIFCCWNEFGEGHYIEPTRGYGFAYLDAIREVFTRAPREHLDIAPEDVGLAPPESWYLQAKQSGLVRQSEQSVWKGAGLVEWGGMMGIGELAVREGVLKFKTTTRDPALSSPPLRLRGNRFSRFVVEMRVSKTSGTQLFWTNALSPSTTEAASVRYGPVPADGQFHRIVFDVGSHELWGGCIRSLRFDPTDQADTEVEIRYIGLE